MITTRIMKIDDYKGVYELWTKVPVISLSDWSDSV